MRKLSIYVRLARSRVAAFYSGEKLTSTPLASLILPLGAINAPTAMGGRYHQVPNVAECRLLNLFSNLVDR